MKKNGNICGICIGVHLKIVWSYTKSNNKSGMTQFYQAFSAVILINYFVHILSMIFAFLFDLKTANQ